MNQKQYQLITLFTSSEKKKYTYTELTEILHVGKRSINNYITEINDFLTENGFHKIRTIHFCWTVPSMSWDSSEKGIIPAPCMNTIFHQRSDVLSSSCCSADRI